MPTFNKRTVKIALLALLGIGILLFGYYLSSVFNPFLIAFLLAYILNPVVNFFEKKKIPRTVSSLAIILVMLAVVIVAMIMVVPLVITQITSLPQEFIGDQYYPENTLKVDVNNNGICDKEDGDAYYDKYELKMDWNKNGRYDPGYMDKIMNYVNDLGNRWHIEIPERDAMQRKLMEKLGGTSGIADKGFSIFKWMLGQANPLLGYITFFALIPIYMFFLLRGMNKIQDEFPKYLPGMYRERILNIWHQIHRAIAGFFRGRLIIAFVCMLFLLPALILADVRFGLIIAIVTGASLIVPYLWIPFGLLPAEVLILLDYGPDYMRLIGIAVWFIFIANLDQFVLTPKVIGKEVELHPVTLILSMFVFGSLLGFFGLMLAIPLMATLKILGKEFVLPELEALAKERSANITKIT